MVNTLLRCLALGCIGGLLAFLEACTTPTSISCIPKDAFFASRANILRATYQIPNWKEVLKDEFELDLDADTMSRPNFLGSGKAYLFGDIFQAEKNYVALSVTILSRHNLEKFIKKMNPNLQIEHFRKYKYIIRNKSILAWTHHSLLLINARQAENEPKLREILFKLASLKPEEVLFKKNENFRKALNNDYDLATWVNIAEIGDIPFLKKFAKNANLQDNYLHLQANFDEGKISTRTQYYTNPKLYEAYKSLLSRSVHKELMANVPVAYPAILLATSIHPEGIKKLLQDIEWSEKAENMVKSITLSRSIRGND
jgi:Domain of unknown function (DUF4836)